MDRRNIKILVNLTGGSGKGLEEETIQRFDQTHPDRFITFTEPSWDQSNQSDYPTFQADEIEKAHRAGARGLKILKTLGLYLRKNVTEGHLVKIDDPRFDPMWGSLWRARNARRHSRFRSRSFFPSQPTAPTNDSKSSITIPTGPSTEKTFQATWNCSKREIA